MQPQNFCGLPLVKNRLGHIRGALLIKLPVNFSLLKFRYECNEEMNRNLSKCFDRIIAHFLNIPIYLHNLPAFLIHLLWSCHNRIFLIEYKVILVKFNLANLLIFSVASGTLIDLQINLDTRHISWYPKFNLKTHHISRHPRMIIINLLLSPFQSNHTFFNSRLSHSLRMMTDWFRCVQ